MKKDLQKLMAERGLTSSLPVTLCLGREEAVKVLGKTVVQDALASVKFPGAKRKVARATWEPYVYDRGNNEFVVTAPEWRQMAKTSGRCWPCYEAAGAHIEYLKEHGRPWRPPNPRYHVSEWQGDLPKVLAFDTEGVDEIVRISAASHTQSLTCQWDETTKQWLREALEVADTVIAHNAQFDHTMLQNEGIDVPVEKWADTMIAHQVLNPWRKRGLGCAAPLYVPGLTPWKHLADGDAEEYSLVDAAVLIPMWTSLSAQLARSHQTKAYEIEMAWTWRSGGEPYRVGGKESDLTKAALIPASCVVDLGSVRAAVGVLSGARLRDADLPPEVELRHLLGYGVRAMRRGTREVSPLPSLCETEKEGETAARLGAYDAQNQAFVKWRDHVWRLADREGFIVAPSGHRAYGFRKGEAQRFLIWNYLATKHKEA